MDRKIVETITTLKERVVGIQIKLNKIEKNCGYSSIDTFECYKAEIDKILEDLEISIVGVEEAVERTLALSEMGWFYGEQDCSYYIGKELKEGSQRVNKKIKQIEDLFSLAISQVVSMVDKEFEKAFNFIYTSYVNRLSGDYKELEEEKQKYQKINRQINRFIEGVVKNEKDNI